MSRRPTPMELTHNRYVDLPPSVEIFNREMLLDVEQKARCADEDTVLASFGLAHEDLNEAEAAVFATAYRRGHAKGIMQAGDQLFNAMSDRGGGPISMEFLRMFSAKFPSDAGESMNSAPAYSLKLMMADE